MAKHRDTQDNKRSDDRGRTRTGRARDRVLGDKDDDHGAAHQVSGRRADHRARQSMVVTTNIFGRTKVKRGSVDRW